MPILSNNALVLSTSGNNAFETLFKKQLNFCDIESLDSKIKFISELSREISETENDAENAKGFTTWTAITCAVTAVATLTMSPVLLPFVGVIAGLSAVSTIGSSALKNNIESKVCEQLKRYSIALAKAPVIDWAALWHCSNHDIFLNALYEASTGQIIDNKLLRTEHSFDSAINYCAALKRLSVGEFTSLITAVKSGVNQVHNPKQPTLENFQETVFSQAQPVPMALPTVLSAAAANEPMDKYITDAMTKYQWVSDVIKMPFRVLTGDAGSGKSTLERFMISKLKEQGYHIVCINTETNPDVWKGVEVLTTASEINEFFSEFVSGIETRQKECRRLGLDEDEFLSQIASKRTGRDGRVAIFFMESNTFELCGVDADLWASVLKMCLTNIRKWGFTACLTAQSDNQTSISSKLKGFAARYDEQPRVDCIVKSDEKTGEAVSSGRGLLKFKGKNDANPKTIQLCNFPKTKDFRTESEKQNAITALATPKVQTQVKDVEEFSEGLPQDSFVTAPENNQNNSRENDFEFIFEMANIAKNHILQNEWTEFSLEKLRTINKFKTAAGRNSFLRKPEIKVVARFLVSSGFLIETSPEIFRVTSLG